MSFGRKGTDAFARRDPDPGAAKIDASTLDGIVKALDALNRDPNRRRSSSDARPWSSPQLGLQFRSMFVLRLSDPQPRARLISCALTVLLSVSACAAHSAPSTAPGRHSRAEQNLAADLSAVFGAHVMEQAMWGVEVRSMATAAVLYERNPRNADDAGVEHEDRHAGHRRQNARVGLPLHNDARDRGAGRSRHAGRRSHRQGRRRPDDKPRATTELRLMLDRWAETFKAAGIEQGRRHESSATTTPSRRDAGRRMGVGLPPVRLCRAGRRARVQ